MSRVRGQYRTASGGCPDPYTCQANPPVQGLAETAQGQKGLWSAFSFFRWKNNTIRKEETRIAMMADKVSDSRRRNMCEFLCCRNDDGFYLGSKPAVCIGNGALVLKVKHIPDAPDNVPDVSLAAYIHSKPIIFNNFNIIHA